MKQRITCIMLCIFLCVGLSACTKPKETIQEPDDESEQKQAEITDAEGRVIEITEEKWSAISNAVNHCGIYDDYRSEGSLFTNRTMNRIEINVFPQETPVLRFYQSGTDFILEHRYVHTTTFSYQKNNQTRTASLWLTHLVNQMNDGTQQYNCTLEVEESDTDQYYSFGYDVTGKRFFVNDEKSEKYQQEMLFAKDLQAKILTYLDGWLTKDEEMKTKEEELKETMVTILKQDPITLIDQPARTEEKKIILITDEKMQRIKNLVNKSTIYQNYWPDTKNVIESDMQNNFTITAQLRDYPTLWIYQKESGFVIEHMHKFEENFTYVKNGKEREAELTFVHFSNQSAMGKEEYDYYLSVPQSNNQSYYMFSYDPDTEKIYTKESYGTQNQQEMKFAQDLQTKLLVRLKSMYQQDQLMIKQEKELAESIINIIQSEPVEYYTGELWYE